MCPVKPAAVQARGITNNVSNSALRLLPLHFHNVPLPNIQTHYKWEQSSWNRSRSSPSSQNSQNSIAKTAPLRLDSANLTQMDFPVPERS
jgi:hypothetical protein